MWVYAFDWLFREACGFRLMLSKRLPSKWVWGTHIMDKRETVSVECPTNLAKVATLGVWQTPDMEILQVSATASGRGAQCEGSVFTNTS